MTSVKTGFRAVVLTAFAAFCIVLLSAQAAFAITLDTDRGKSPGQFIIALDPGHGGSDPGAMGNGVAESSINLKIAVACRNELEKVYGAKVYMTRTDDTYVGVRDRVINAYGAGADVFVCLHNNSDDNPAANGSEVWAPVQKDDRLDEEGWHLATCILNRIVQEGLTNRGVKTRINSAGTGDYYGVIDESRKHGIVGIIVEHAFVSNAKDATLLRSDSFLERLGKADAHGIAEAYGLAKTGDGWELSGGKWRYRVKDDGRYDDSNSMAGGKGYRYLKDYWLYEAGNWYWLNSSGVMVTGWNTIGSERYCFSNGGAMQTGWIMKDGNWYFFDRNSGAMITGWAKDGSTWYYMNKSGAMQTGWITDGSGRYYLQNSGALATGWFLIGGTWYYATASDGVSTGWLTQGSTRYYLDSKGAMRTGWFTVDDTWYYAHGSGAIATGWLNSGGAWYYLKGTGAMATGWLDLGSTRYYLTSSGAMATDWFKVGSDWYWAYGSGSVWTSGGWWYTGGIWYYFHSGTGKMATGTVKIGNEYHSFADSGRWLKQVSQPQESNSAQQSSAANTPIMGASKATVSSMVKTYNAQGAAYPTSALSKGGAGSIEEFCKIISEEAQAEGVRAEVLFAQVMLETGWLQFGGDVKISQFNFGGLGATGNGVPGNSFGSVREGLRAQTQHLKAYASKDPLKNACVDTRFSYVSRGSAMYVEWLGIPDNPNGGGWASGAGYGKKIIEIMNKCI